MKKPRRGAPSFCFPAGRGMLLNAVKRKRRRGGKALNAKNPKRRRRIGISFDVIPLHLKTEILLRLPVRSLLRFRRVCKHWLSVIQDPQFIQSHLDLSRKTRLPSIIFFPSHGRRGSACITRFDADKPLSPSVSFINQLFSWLKPDRVHVDGSCNGLFAVASVGSTTHVVNPSTGQSITVPKRTKSHPSNVLPPFVSLGYHPVTKEYKLVSFFGGQIHEDDDDECTGSEVYTLGTSSWRQIASLDCLPSSSHVAVSAKGFMYWGLHSTEDGISLLRFDLRDEVFTRTPTIKLNQFYEQWDRYEICHGPVVLRGSICLPVYPRSKMPETPQMDIWILNEDDHSWSRQYSIAFPLGERSFQNRPKPLLIHDNRVLMPIVKGNFEPLRCTQLTCSLQYHRLTSCDQELVNDSTSSHEEVVLFNNSYDFYIVHDESLISLPEDPTQRCGAEATPSPDVTTTIRTYNWSGTS